MIIVKNLVKRYSDFNALNGLSFEVNENEIFGLLGPNGAGKTTLIHILSTLLKPTQGGAIVNGFDVLRDATKVRESIGVVFQAPSSDDILTGYENLKVHALLYGIPRKIREKRISEVLELVGLEDRKDDQVKKYSGGMRRRLEIARGLLHNPKVFFLDEPTLGLDPQSRETMWRYIKKIVKEEKVTIILTTHYMEEADMLCDRIGFISNGKIIALDSPSKLKQELGGDIVKVTFNDGIPSNRDFSHFDFVHKVEQDGNSVIIYVDEVNSNMHRLIKDLEGVQTIEYKKPTLNDVFLKLSGIPYPEIAQKEDLCKDMLSTRKHNSKIVLGQLYALWLREIKVFLRERSRLVASTFTPLLWLFVIGSGLGSTNLQIGTEYEKFIFLGIICMSVIFTSVFFGSYIIWDRKFDFLKSVMVAPASRTTVFIGKTFGGMTTSLFQVAIILGIGIALGINYDALTLLQILSIVLILSFCLTSLGLTFGSYIESLEGFQLIVSFVVFPLFFLSGALFPIDNLPAWLKFITLVDPATYSVDALRNSILHLGTYSFELDLAILLLFTFIITLIGIFSFKRMKAV